LALWLAGKARTPAAGISNCFFGFPAEPGPFFGTEPGGTDQIMGVQWNILLLAADIAPVGASSAALHEQPKYACDIL